MQQQVLLTWSSEEWRRSQICRQPMATNWKRWTVEYLAARSPAYCSTPANNRSRWMVTHWNAASHCFKNRKEQKKQSSEFVPYKAFMLIFLITSQFPVVRVKGVSTAEPVLWFNLTGVRGTRKSCTGQVLRRIGKSRHGGHEIANIFRNCERI